MPKSGAAVWASRALTKSYIQAAITNQRATFTNPLVNPAHVDAKQIADATERDAILSTILRKSDSEVARIMAARELNKVGGRHITKLEHNLPSVPAGGVLFVIQQQPGAENRT